MNISRNKRVFIVGNSNFKFLSSQLKSSLNEEIIYVKYTFNILATVDEIESFMDNIECGSNNIIILDGMGNSLVQGMLIPKYKLHQPSGEPAGFAQVGARKTKVFHALNVAPYDPEYFNNFGSFADKIVRAIKKHGTKLVFITPLPRYIRPCCSNARHSAGYSGNEFNAEVNRLGTLSPDYHHLKGPLSLPLRISVTETVGFAGTKQYVTTLSIIPPHAITLVWDLVQCCIHFLRGDPEMPLPSLFGYVPEDLLFSKWVEEFRPNCGYDDLMSRGSLKCSLPTHKLQRPSKR